MSLRRGSGLVTLSGHRMAIDFSSVTDYLWSMMYENHVGAIEIADEPAVERWHTVRLKDEPAITVRVEVSLANGQTIDVVHSPSDLVDSPIEGSTADMLCLCRAILGRDASWNAKRCSVYYIQEPGLFLMGSPRRGTKLAVVDAWEADLAAVEFLMRTEGSDYVMTLLTAVGRQGEFVELTRPEEDPE